MITIKQRGRNEVMDAYLFVHFREKESPDGEQIYFALSQDGFNWETVNKGRPVLWSENGEKGVRDHSIVRAKNGKFYILATDLRAGLHFLFHASRKEQGKAGSRIGVLVCDRDEPFEIELLPEGE
ncbi:hypothetical protein ACFPPD_24365 [Cohnella suwonensis]|uniref:Beta-xylosidase C-terminal Concanavalin A-like domain-containing protein n=1 Tax=Cohnella suwonensis TaxID=696072 RepID=A0ABW0M150_9BACL